MSNFKTDYNSESKAIGLPEQMVSTKTKQGKAFQKDTTDYFVSNLYSTGNDIRKSTGDMQSNIRIYNSCPEPSDLSDSFDPLGFNSDEDSENLPIKGTFYNVMNNPLKTLFGEELKRRSDIRAAVTNQFAINKKDKEFQKRLMSYLMSQVQAEAVDEEDFNKKIQELDRFGKYDLQSAHEKMANQIIQILANNRELNLKRKFNRGFEKLNVIAEEVFRVGSIGDEPWVFDVNSENFKVLGLGDSTWIQDGWAWIEYDYLHPNKIVEEFGRILSSSDIKKVVNIDGDGFGGNITPITSSYIDNGEIIIGGNGKSVSEDGSFFTLDGESHTNDKWVDEDGHIRVVRFQYLGYRKIGELKYYDEQGDEQRKFVDEYREPNIELGEEVEWFWINELMEGGKIGEDIYLPLEPSKVQMRSIINPSMVRSHYVGVVSSLLGGKARCVVDDVKPYQLDYNTWMIKLKHLFTQHIGNVAIFDVSRIPSDMTTDEWFKWVSILGIAFENPFEESSKGKIAGMMQQRSSSISIDKSKEIMQAVNMLNTLEDMINKIAAVPAPRQGELSGKEGLGISQEAIVRSSAQTESVFQLHEDVKAVTYAHAIEFVKVLWKDKKIKRQLQLDDLSNYIIDIDGATLNEAELGVQTTNSSRVYEMENEMRQLSHAAMQTGNADLSDIARIRLATSPSEMLKTLEQAEEKKVKQQQQQQQMQNEAQQQQLAAQQQFEQIKHQQELEKIDKEYEYKIELKRMELEDKMDSDVFGRQSVDDNKDGVEDQVELDKQQMVSDTKEKEIASKEKMFYDELKVNEQLELAKIKAQKEIAGKRSISTKKK